MSHRLDAPAPLCGLSAIERDLLILCATRAPVSGDEIKRALRGAYTDEHSVAHSTLYPNLDGLVEKGFLQKQPHAEDGRRNQYTVTETGRKRVIGYRRWLVQEVDVPTPLDRLEESLDGSSSLPDPE